MNYELSQKKHTIETELAMNEEQKKNGNQLVKTIN